MGADRAKIHTLSYTAERCILTLIRLHSWRAAMSTHAIPLRSFDRKHLVPGRCEALRDRCGRRQRYLVLGRSPAPEDRDAHQLTPVVPLAPVTPLVPVMPLVPLTPVTPVTLLGPDGPVGPPLGPDPPVGPVGAS